jgi:hypothetical protein
MDLWDFFTSSLRNFLNLSQRLAFLLKNSHNQIKNRKGEWLRALAIVDGAQRCMRRHQFCNFAHL